MKTNVTLSLDVDLVLRLNQFAKTHDMQKSQIHAEAVEVFMAKYEEDKRNSRRGDRQ